MKPVIKFKNLCGILLLIGVIVGLGAAVARQFSEGIETDTIGEVTSGSGVTIDGVLHKDSEITTAVINNTGVLTLPTSTDTLVGRSTTDTLISKSIDCDSNTVTDISNDEIKAGAAIDAAKIHDGTVDNTEFGYLNGVSSAIQTQLGNKAAKGANTDITSILNAAFYNGRDADNNISWATDDQLKITIAGVLTSIASITTGTGDNDKLVTQGYVDDNATGDVTGPAGGTAQYQAAVYADATGKVLQASQFYTDASGSIDIPTGQNYKINGTQIALNNLLNVVLTSPGLGDMIYYNGTNWVKIDASAAADGDVPMKQADNSIAFETPPGAAGGETNTASNVGTAGVGIFKQKAVADLEFYKVLGSAGISWALNGTDYIDAKVVINTLDEKTSVVAADELLLSDSQNSNAIKKVLISTLFGVYETIYVDAGAMVPCTTNPADNSASPFEYGTNDIDMDFFAFDGGATEERVQFKWAMPDEWDRGTVKVKFFWSSATGSTAGDTVEWGIKAGAISDNDAIDAALGTAVTVSDTLLADNGGDMQVTAASAAMTVGGTPALGDMIVFEIYRNTDGTDDMTEDAWLFGIQIQWKRATAPIAAW
ncbi:MAG: hypothetical protein WC373_01795 [Smithella sp.]|jgi:hypothetical protein